MKIIINPLDAFYIVGAIVVLVTAIIGYSTFKYGPKDEEEHKFRKH